MYRPGGDWSVRRDGQTQLKLIYDPADGQTSDYICICI